MATYGVLQATVANDITRSDYPAEIAAAIKAAIKDVDNRRFWFNETKAFTFDTVVGQADYPIAANATLRISDFIKVDWMRATINGRVRTLRQDTDPEALDGDIAQDLADASYGDPSRWGYYQKQFRLYPIPDAVYTVTVAGHVRFQELAADGDEDPWTNEGYELIRSQAAARVLFRPMQAFELASTFNQVAADELTRLRDETNDRLKTGSIRPLRGGF